MSLKVIAYVVLVAALVGCGWLYGRSRYTAGRNDLIAEQKDAADAQRKDAEARTVAGDAGSAKAVQQGEVKQATSVAKTNTVVTTVTRYVHEKPSPVVCAMQSDDPVLRELTDAAARANAAGSAVSGTRARGDDRDAAQ